MIGAAYLRELYLRNLLGQKINYNSSTYSKNISNDILNPITFSIAVNDLFFRIQTIKINNNKHTLDRGYAFENTLNRNTMGVMKNKTIGDYTWAEKKALIPMMVISPTILNDGRKLYISSQPVSYLTNKLFDEKLHFNKNIEGVEFLRFFKNQDAHKLHFTTALRMSASFPYISPVVQMPCTPQFELMDSGARDNYGFEITLRMLELFKEWIEKNTSGVIIVSVRDRFKSFDSEKSSKTTLIKTLTAPVDALYSNLFHVQDFNQDLSKELIAKNYPVPIDIIDFQLRNQKPDNISLSWHLTKKEKRKVFNSIYIKENQDAIRKLEELLKK
jgi:hypothetical protein